MHHACGVDRAQALRQARGQRQQRPRRQRPMLIYRLGQRRPGNIRRRQPRRRAVDIRVHHHGREHAAHPARRGDLPPEPHPEVRIRGQLNPDDLYRDRPPARGNAKEHPPHAAAAKLAYQPVRADRLRIPGLQSPDHASPPTSPETSLTYIRHNHDNDLFVINMGTRVVLVRIGQRVRKFAADLRICQDTIILRVPRSRPRLSAPTGAATAPPGRFSEIQVSIRSHQSYSHWT